MRRKHAPLNRLSFLPLVVLLPLLLAHSLRPVVGAPPQERELEDRIPKHLPIKIKVKNLNNEKWLRDLEIEVKNTGDKPIYFLKISLFFIDVKRESGDQIGYPLVYGRTALVDVGNRAMPDDVPINPGDIYVFKIHDSHVKGWNFYKSKSHKPEPKRVGLRFDALNFGDGTGFVTSGGLPVPEGARSCVGEQKPPNVATLTTYIRPRYPDGPQAKLTDEQLPAVFLPVIFFGSMWGMRLTCSALPQTCCPSTSSSCERMKVVEEGNCFCPPYESFSIVVDHSCSDAAARCSIQRTENADCGEGETYHICTNFFLDPCCTEDRDGDGYYAASCGGNDCDDSPGTGFDINPGQNEGAVETQCSDLLDNDCDGFIDCVEPACQLKPVCQPAPTPPSDCPNPTYYIREPVTGTCVCRNGNTPRDCQADQLWYPNICDCRAKGGSPIVVDVNGDGFALTDAAHGVAFDLRSTGLKEQWAWTIVGADDAWLVLDRNGNGRVDDGRELFGNFTPQPAAPDPNGFLALAEYDKAAQGGNGDGQIDARDTVFSALRLWQDANHNGVSEANELHSLPELDLVAISLAYHEAKCTDSHGNQFRYRAKVDDARHAKAGRWAWDVYLSHAP
jgi:hypothetical protein